MMLLLIVSTVCTAEEGESSYKDDIEIPTQKILSEINENDIFCVDVPIPQMEDHIDILDNELFTERGILPVSQWYEYSVIPEECIQTEDSYTEVVRFFNKVKGVQSDEKFSGTHLGLGIGSFIDADSLSSGDRDRGKECKHLR